MKKSFLKWAGGKSQSIKIILEEIYSDLSFLSTRYINRFIEPFVGSGVVFLNVEADEYIISDINTDLINVYKTLQKDSKHLIKEARVLFTTGSDEESYYKFRRKFNSSKDVFEKAVLFLYLNRFCFNGLCRYNKVGKFNVPYGHPTKVYFPEKELKSMTLKLEKTKIYNQSFEKTFELTKENDTVYNDPPYVSLSETSNFTDYSKEGFTDEDQYKLALLAEQSKAKVLISNHDTKFSRELYKNAKKTTELLVTRFISADGDKRKPVKELLVSY